MAELIEKIKISELTETTTADDASYIPIDNGNVTYKITVANYNSGANATAKSYAEAAATSATAAAGSATYVENALDEVQNIYSDFEDEKLDLLNQFSSITQSVQSASNSATRAAASATSAATSAQNCATIETSVKEDETLAESWAVGGTNTREGEDTNNSKYYAEQASAVASDLPNLVGPAVEGYLDDHPVQAPVTSVNNQTGDVVLDIPAEVTESTVAGWGFTKNTGTYSKPNTGIPATDLATAVQTSLEKADTALQSAPVTSVNGKTGAVNLSASDVGALPLTTFIPTKTSELTNNSNFVSDANYVHTDNNFTTVEKNKLNGIESGAEVNAVNSVNGEVGDVTIAVPTKTSELQNDSGFLTAIPSEYVTDSELSTALAQKAPVIINSASGDIVALSDGADDLPFKSVAVNIAPLQSGSGDPSPDNVRPISGWTAVNIYQSGVDTSNPTVYPITLPTEAGTVYGGVLDVVKGTLTVDRAMVTLNGTNYPVGQASSSVSSPVLIQAIVPNIALISTTDSTKIVSDYLPPTSDNAIYTSGNLGVAVHYAVAEVARRIWMRLPNVTTEAEAKTYLASNPLTIVYPLVTSQTYTLTPTEICTLLGNNTLWADAGAVDVQYPADTKLYIDGKIAELQALVLENNG